MAEKNREVRTPNSERGRQEEKEERQNDLYFVAESEMISKNKKNREKKEK